MPNTDLLHRTLAAIEANPDDWNQGDWRKCFAGKAAELAGGQWVDATGNELVLEREDPDWCRDLGETFSGTRAYRVLGLRDADEGTRGLFVSTNTLDDLRRIVGELTGAPA